MLLHVDIVQTHVKLGSIRPKNNCGFDLVRKSSTQYNIL